MIVFLERRRVQMDHGNKKKMGMGGRTKAMYGGMKKREKAMYGGMKKMNKGGVATAMTTASPN